MIGDENPIRIVVKLGSNSPKGLNSNLSEF